MMPVHPHKGAQMRMDWENTPVGPQKGPILRIKRRSSKAIRMEWKKTPVRPQKEDGRKKHRSK